MPRRAKSICRKMGCSVLIDAPGYCATHTHVNNAFVYQDRKKTAETKRFYSSGRWTKKSKQHRVIEPLCRECKKRGIIKPCEMVHHDPPLEILLSKGLNPLDDKYLASLCNDCHLGHLREKKN